MTTNSFDYLLHNVKLILEIRVRQEYILNEILFFIFQEHNFLK